MLQHLPDEPNNRTPPSCTALPRKLTDHFNTVTAMCFSSIYILEQTLSHYGIETRPPFAASPRAHDPRGRSPWAAPSRRPPGASPRPVSTLDSNTPLGPGTHSPQCPGEEQGWGLGVWGDWDRGQVTLAPPPTAALALPVSCQRSN